MKNIDSVEVEGSACQEAGRLSQAEMEHEMDHCQHPWQCPQACYAACVGCLQKK